jgi:predicted metal-binding membrane protein
MASVAVSQRAFYGTAALLFGASAALTVAWCGAMSGMDGMPMPGGWTMSMAWMRMPGQSWAGAAASFLGMWSVMMVAMMLPSLLPLLRRYRLAVEPAGAACLDELTARVGTAYFLVWIGCGVLAFPLGVALAALEMDVPALARAVPLATGVVVLLAGVLQFSRWKAHHLACCRGVHCDALAADAGTAWRHGLRLGWHCCTCCAGQTAVLLAVGVMDLRAMAAVTVAITMERLAPGGERMARVIGVVLVGVGLVLMAQANGLW